MRVYIAGPMRGYPDFNKAAFDAAELLLKEIGHDPVNPSRMDEELGLHFEKDEDVTNEHLKQIMLRDIDALFACDAIALLPGWLMSKGACLERQAAQYVGIPAIELTTAQMEIGYAARESAHEAESHSGTSSPGCDSGRKQRVSGNSRRGVHRRVD